MPSQKRPEGGQGALDFGGSSKPSAPPEPHVFSVAELVRSAGRAIEARFGDVWVEGELSNLSQPRSGHLYFTLKDAEAQLQAVMWRSTVARMKFRVEDGMRVRVRGKLSIYDAQGKFQMYVEKIEPAGVGEAQVAFEQLKAKLAEEGLFTEEKKRPLPAWPKRIGVVTSATGAAVRDILHVAGRRGRMRFLISPCQVQGDAAAKDIVRALHEVERAPGVDVVIIARGGGSAEDLAAFNDEALARAIAACPHPVVSAVGHEVDFTIADFVADLRAPTPSAAAEIVVPLWLDAKDSLDDANQRLRRAHARVVGDARQRLDDGVSRAHTALERVLAKRRRQLAEFSGRLSTLHPRARLSKDRAALVHLRSRLDIRMRSELERRRLDFSMLTGKLHAMSPLGVLSRGYAIARDKSGHVIREAGELKVGSDVRVRLGRGELGCRVQSIEEE